jgi:ABC-type spermidine/putrescine transport system permease subunit II
MATATAGTPPRRRVDWTNVALLVWGIGTIIFLFLPILLITIYSFNSGQALLVWKGFSFSPFQRALQTQVILNAMTTSVRVAFVSAVIATILGAFAGLALARRPGKWTVLFVGLIALVLVTPEIVDGISMLLWFVKLNDLGFGFFANGWIRLFVGTSLFAVAVVTLIVRARVSGLDESLEEAAADLYATPWNRFRQVTLPLLAPAVIASFLLAFSLSLDNTIISQFVSTAGATPWPVYVWGSVKNGLKPEVAAMSTVLLGLTILALVLVAVVLRRSGDSSKQIAATLAGQ